MKKSIVKRRYGQLVRSFLMGLFGLLGLGQELGAQTQGNENYIRRYEPRKPISQGSLLNLQTSEDDAIITTVYMDGFGRPKQSVLRRASPDRRDVIIPNTYDAIGREVRYYLPYVSDHSDPATNQTGNYRNNAFQEQRIFYNNLYGGTTGNYAYGESLLENSPLSRVLKEAAPGETWNLLGDHTVDYAYRNSASTDQVRKLSFSLAQGTISSNSFYLDNQLQVREVRDENNGDSESHTMEFQDGLGRTVLRESKVSATEYLKTYFIYDLEDNLVFVVPPAAVKEIEGLDNWELLNDESFRKKWLHAYVYDNRNRMIAKRNPGTDWQNYIYDVRDRIVLYQNGNQHQTGFRIIEGDVSISSHEGQSYYIKDPGTLRFTSGFTAQATEDNPVYASYDDPPEVVKEWNFVKYDHLNRPVLTGFYRTTLSLENLRGQVAAVNGLTETYNGGATHHGYDNAAFPSVAEEDLLSIIYYDSYDFTTEVAPAGATRQLTGLPTGGKERVLGSNQWLTSVHYYDEKYRPMKSVLDNHLQGVDVVETEYLNTVNHLVTEVTNSHTSSQQAAVLKVKDQITYDHLNRTVNVQKEVQEGAVVKLQNNTLIDIEYDVLGRLKTKHLQEGGIDGQQQGVYIQDVDYSYNLRNWLTKINEGADAIGGAGNTDVFAMDLQYETAGQYNGNIGQVDWKNLGGPGYANKDKQTFVYGYDPMSRLKTATYSSPAEVAGAFNVGGDDQGGIRYDANGNILNLHRYKKLVEEPTRSLIDELTYTYEGDQLLDVTDNGDSEKGEGFQDGSNADFDYRYDANGNLTKDLNKDIVNMSYNHLNLPIQVDFENGDWVKYSYSASGIKLSKQVKTGSSTEMTEYIADKVYQNGSLAYFMHQEGRVVKAGADFVYEYNLTDHLGNVRATINGSGEVTQRDDYYPFGLRFQSWQVSPENPYLFNGVEYEGKTQSYETVFRGYEPALGRFMQVDPLTDVIPGISSYHFGFNNPVKFSDPLGLIGETRDGLGQGSAGKKFGNDRKRRKRDRKRNNSKTGRGKEKTDRRRPRGESVPDPTLNSSDDMGILHFGSSESITNQSADSDNGAPSNKKELIDLSKPGAGQKIADFLRDFNIRNKLKDRLPHGEREERPYLEDFIDLDTKFPNLARELARYLGGGWGSQISGSGIKILDETWDVWIIGRPGSENRRSSDTQYHGIRLAGLQRSQWNKAVDFWQVVIKNGDGEGLIIFEIKANKPAAVKLRNYIRGY